MRQVAPGVVVVERPQRFLGLEVGARMTVLQLADGLLVHSPVGVDPASLAPLGDLRWVLAPNLLHHLYVAPFLAAGAEGWGAPGLAAKRPDLALTELAPGVAAPFGDEVEVRPLTCFPFSNEVALLHRPSRTLVLTDLVFHFAPTAPALTRGAMWLAGAYPGCRASLLEQVLMRREVAREEIGGLLAMDFDRLIMAHGEVIEADAKAALRGAYGWLGV
jgi:hypothetical protein